MKTTQEIARSYGVSDQHILNLANAGTIPGLLLGSDWRFDPEKVQAALEEDTIKRRKLKAKP